MLNNSKRLTFTEYGAFLAFGASLRATCPRRIVGCSLFNSKRMVISTGYNGAPSGAPQCDEIGCLMVNGHCRRTSHAEKNAVLFAGNRNLSDGYAFVTTRPCKDCFHIMTSVGIKNIFYIEEYRPEPIKAKGIKLEKLQSGVIDLLQKALNFHQDSGGLLIMKHPLKIVEQFPTDWDE